MSKHIEYIHTPISCENWATDRTIEDFYFRLEMILSLSTLKVAAKHRATRCLRLQNIYKSPWTPFLLLVAILALVSDAKEVATNTFYVKIHSDPAVPDLAHKIARRNGFHNLGPVSDKFPNILPPLQFFIS